MANVINLLKQCNFQLILAGKKVLELFVQEVNMPGFTLGDMPINHWTQNENRIGDNIMWNDLDLTVVCDENLGAYKEVYKHVIAEKNPFTGFLDPITTTFDGKLLMTTNKNNVSHEIIYRNCWIVSLGDMQLTTTSSEDEQVTFTVGIKYTYWEFA